MYPSLFEDPADTVARSAKSGFTYPPPKPPRRKDGDGDLAGYEPSAPDVAVSWEREQAHSSNWTEKEGTAVWHFGRYQTDSWGKGWLADAKNK